MLKFWDSVLRESGGNVPLQIRLSIGQRLAWGTLTAGQSVTADNSPFSVIAVCVTYADGEFRRLKVI